ncbi:hypothetical protein ACUTAF_09180 [Pseudomonas sp. SP16.1]|uniref:hypothetical protein n=1 Tax=Pseudomonas sp. SP16.1 TaxID=3458854 RepID=UPI004045350A
MTPDLNSVKMALSVYDVSMIRRPDGSVLLIVSNNGRRLRRVFDESYSTDEIIRTIKFDMTLRSEGASVSEAVKYCSGSSLPTYSREPIYQTRTSRLWSLRKIVDR